MDRSKGKHVQFVDHWWYPEGELTPTLEPLGGHHHRVVVTGETVIDPLPLTGDVPVNPGAYQVWAGAQLLGVGRRPRPDRHHPPRPAPDHRRPPPPPRRDGRRGGCWGSGAEAGERF
ncbi:hypothetical protein OG407_43035 [Streptomyces sp. NBC_01515]|uniref:hypothetical protein n=1 Tax=Streptomyces sp. NBC_01515 TaxID=2903890 RepID=UPI00386CD717